MTNTSIRPITVDGVRLDTLGWNVTKRSMATARRVTRDTTAPFSDGATPSLWDNLEPAEFSLQMWVRGTDHDGVVPGAGSVTSLQNNLDELLHLFGKRHALLDVQEATDGVGGLRRAYCKVTDVMAPDLNDVGTVAQFTVGLTIPSGSWEDLNTQDWVGALGVANLNVAQDVTTLQGATERIGDGIFLVTGPIQSPAITDPNTGAFVALQATLGATDKWLVRTVSWASRIGTTLTLASSDTAGADATATTTYGGVPTSGGPMLPLTPVRVSSSPGAVRKVQVRAKRHWAV